MKHGADNYRLNEPRWNPDVDFKAFKVCAPRLYNRLPVQVKVSNITELKTYLFRDAYDISDITITDHYIV